MQLKKYKNIIFIICFIIFTAVTIFWTIDEEYEKPKEEITVKDKIKKEERIDEKNQDKIVIDIKGEVITPGVYELTSQNNVNDAIKAAGGLTQNSDTSNINLSKKLKDEMVIIVYSKKEIEEMKKEKTETCQSCNNACIKTEDEEAKIIDEESELININEATKEQLQKLEGIGQSKAEAIIEYRNKNQKFKEIEEIKNVPGIGEAAYEKIKNHIKV